VALLPPDAVDGTAMDERKDPRARTAALVAEAGRSAPNREKAFLDGVLRELAVA
jgi:hypothetical protein